MFKNQNMIAIGNGRKRKLWPVLASNKQIFKFQYFFKVGKQKRNLTQFER